MYCTSGTFKISKLAQISADGGRVDMVFIGQKGKAGIIILM